MDPDEDINRDEMVVHSNTSNHHGSSSRHHGRREHNHYTSAEVAMPNSSRRLANRRARGRKTTDGDIIASAEELLDRRNNKSKDREKSSSSASLRSDRKKSSSERAAATSTKERKSSRRSSSSGQHNHRSQHHSHYDSGRDSGRESDTKYMHQSRRSSSEEVRNNERSRHGSSSRGGEKNRREKDRGRAAVGDSEVTRKSGGKVNKRRESAEKSKEPTEGAEIKEEIMGKLRDYADIEEDSFEDIDGVDELTDHERDYADIDEYSQIEEDDLNDMDQKVGGSFDEYDDIDGIDELDGGDAGSIEQADYYHATYYDEGEGTVITDRYGEDDSDLEDIRRDDHMEEESFGGMKSVASVKRSNSPELNPCLNAELAEGEKEETITSGISQDPPTAQELTRAHSESQTTALDHGQNDPNEEEGSMYRNDLEIGAPPSPRGPERNDRRSNNAVRGGGYTNYQLDDVGMEQYRQMKEGDALAIPLPVGEEQLQITDRVSNMSVRRQADPPEMNRGCDVPAPHADPSYRRGPRVRSSKSNPKKDPDSTTKQEKKKPEIKGILRKKNSAPPPIAYFGKAVSPPPGENDSDEGSSTSNGSNPSITEEKSVRTINDHDEKSVGTAAKGGLRSGRFAAINAAAAKVERGEESSGDDSLENEHDEDADYKASDDEIEEENTLPTLGTNDNGKFDRSKTHFLRTSDLGLTQDTIFAEQFMDNPNSKPEPHYHHPTPHPPPGVQFHIDENWIAVDDGHGGHSPIAPQAVDALVAMGYRTAADPVMWTPTSKTRKYMTEKGLRFDDIPIPGPLEEGDGGPGDSTCLVWSGKFAHKKYHGSDLPAIRSQGIVNMSAEELVDLLMDSNRVNEYNKSSIGRDDELVLSDGTNLDTCPFSGRRKKRLTGVVMENARIVDGVAIVDSTSDDERSETEHEEIVEEFDDSGVKSVRTISTFGKERRVSEFVGVTKLVRSTNKPPFVKKKLEFVTLLHCRALTDDQGGNGYIIVGRAVTPAEDAEKDGKKVMRSEILLNVHIIRRLRSKKKSSSNKGKSRNVEISTSGKSASKSDLANRCLMINVNHLKSPMIPNMLAKKVGLSAAVNFLTDIRGLTE